MLLNQLKEVLPEYIEYSYSKGLGEYSIRMRELYIQKFIEYMDKIYVNPPNQIEYINDGHIFSYLDWKKEQGRAIYSLDNYFKNIKYFFDYMYDKKNMKTPVLRGVPGPIVDREKHDRQYDSLRNSVLKMMVEKKWELAVIADICGMKQKSLHKYIDVFTSDAELKETIYLDNHPFVK